MYPEKKISKFKKNNNLRKKMVENNMPQSAELGSPRAIALLFCGHQSTRAFSQKAPSGLVRIQKS
jgi:hypothetical protein